MGSRGRCKLDELESMKSKKVSAILTIILFLSLSVLCQNSNADADSSRYPNELKGYELMKRSKLKTLIPGISTETDVLTVFGEKCKKHERLGVCELDENWYVSFTYDGETDSGILWSINFYPHRRLPFLKVKFPKRFVQPLARKV